MSVKHFVCLPTMFVCEAVVKWRLFSYNSIPILSWDLVGIQHKYSSFKSIFHRCPEKLVSQNISVSQNLKTCPRIYIYYMSQNLSLQCVPESIFTMCPRIYIYNASQNLYLLYVPESISICPRIYIYNPRIFIYYMSQNLHLIYVPESISMCPRIYIY